jgi:MFS family permease
MLRDSAATAPLHSKREINIIYTAGVAQGIALVTFPAASAIFTSSSDYGLSNSEYGAMFLPQAIMAITFSLLGAGLSRRIPTRVLYLLGLAANLVAMALLLASSLYEGEPAAYPTLLVATASLGIGFGLTVPAINTLTAAFHPDAVDSSVLVLNALLGLGTALAPVLVAIFVGLGFWWGLPGLALLLLGALFLVSLRLSLATGSRPSEGTSPSQSESAVADSQARSRTRMRIPARFYLYACFAVLYGICETMNGNWAQVDVHTELGNSVTVASIALTAFWGSVTLGRVGFAAIQQRFPTRRTYRLLPFVLAVAFGLIAVLPDDEPVLAILAFALAGIGCSALLPLTITFGQEELMGITAAVAGGVIAFYQLGYGIAAFGAGPIQSDGVELSTLYAVTGIVALGLGALAWALTRRHPGSSTVHPRPEPVTLPSPGSVR